MRVASLLGGLALFLMAGCSNNSPSPTAPGNAPPAADLSCGSGGTVSLGTLTGTTISCSGGDLLTLAGKGAHYLIVPQFATSDVANQSYNYAVGMARATAGSVAAARAALPTGTGLTNSLQSRFDAALLNANRVNIASGRWNIAASRALALSAAAAPLPALNSERTFHVYSTLSTTNPAYKTVGARLSYIGSTVLIYVDSLAPAGGVSASDLQRIGALFDQTLYPLDLSTFGPPTDIDGNGRMIMLMSPVVNALSPASQCATQGYVTGFFDGSDLADTSNPNSNQGEIFYTITPDPNGTVSCAHDLTQFMQQVPATFLHEVQHLISFSQHVIIHGGAQEEGWLDEGLSRIAEELGSIHYEKEFPAPSGRTNPAQLFPDSAEGYITGVLTDSYSYLLNPPAETVTLHSDSDTGLAWRGGDWLLLRWIGDQYGTGAFKQLDETNLTGTANIAAVTGTPFSTLFGDFSLSLYTDSLPGISRGAVPPQDRFSSRNLRRLYQALYRVAGPSTQVPLPFPIPTVQLSGANAAVSGAMVPGTMAFYLLDTPTDSTTVHIRFSTSAGQPLPVSLAPQVSVFRLPG